MTYPKNWKFSICVACEKKIINGGKLTTAGTKHGGCIKMAKEKKAGTRSKKAAADVNPKTGYRTGTLWNTLGVAFLKAGKGDKGREAAKRVLKDHRKKERLSVAPEILTNRVSVFVWTSKHNHKGIYA